jgi:UDP-glucuronate 4-epimerase
MKILVTGSAGFIGCEVALRLLADGHTVIGLDNLNPYYDVSLKNARIARLTPHSNYTHAHIELSDRAQVDQLFQQYRPERVVHLAAQAGVRYAAENPHIYVSSNIVGFLHIIENCRHFGVNHLVYASTSSVYGANETMPFTENQACEHPLTLYAASKKANELMAHSYAHLFQIPCTGLRFFTVYGPWGRPDMALFKFAKAILTNQPIELYNYGQHKRSFTYISDIVEGVVRILAQPPNKFVPLRNAPTPGCDSAVAPYKIYNIGNAESVPLLDYVDQLEIALGQKAQRILLPLQAGDVQASEASVARLFDAVGYQPQVSVAAGVARFVKWFKEHPQFGGI